MSHLHVVLINDLWIGSATRLSVSLIQERDGRWNCLISRYRSGSGGLQPGARIVFPVEYLRDFSDAIAKALQGALARDITAA
jgi:hypothetical protein